MEIKDVTDLVGVLQRAKGGMEYPCGRAVFLIGAGCSRSANIPIGTEIAESCAIKLAECYSNGLLNSPNPAEAIAWLKANNRLPENLDSHRLYGHLFEHHYQDPTEQQRIILDAIERSKGSINWAHLCLGEMVSQHYIHTVLTTNFDQLVLEGIIRTGILPVVADGIEALSRLSGKPQYPQVVHLHGSMHTYRPLNSDSDVKDTDQELLVNATLYNMLHDSSVLVIVGYAGGEEGVMSLLIEAAKRLPDKVVYWVQYSPDPGKLSDKATELLHCGKNKYLIPDQDADAFFAGLMKGLGLGVPEWMKFPIAALRGHAARIAPTDNRDITEEVERYRKRLKGLEQCLEKESTHERLLSEIRELRLAGKHEEALGKLRTLEDSRDPEVWGMRGESAYEVGRYSPGSDLLQESIAAWRRHLEFVRREDTPDEWARSQINLGNTLAVLGERESDQVRLEEAAAVYREALKEFTREHAPLDWATIQNNLGNALVALGERESSSGRLEEAVAAFREALKEYTRERMPMNWAMAQNNLGNALRVLGERKDGVALLEEAMAACREALKEHTRERVPLDWAATQNNLGNALRVLGEREDSPALLGEAVAVYREALKESTRERVPLDWAMTQNNLGIALEALGDRKDSPALLEEAVAACGSALEILRASEASHYIEKTEDNLRRVQSLLEAAGKAT